MIKLRQIFIYLQDFLEYRQRRSRDAKVEISDQVLLVQVGNPNLYHRFFYLFLKQWQRAGYQIYFPMGLDQYRNIKHNNPYFGWIVNEESLVLLHEPPQNTKKVTLRDQDLSADFFHDFFHQQNVETGFHFPMTFHPIMFHRNLDLQEITPKEKRINSLYTFGNFEKENYSEIDRTAFKVINRYKLLKFFSKKPTFVSIKNHDELESILKNQPEKKFFFVEKEHHEIPIEKVRETLSHFDFFLACPGVVMPHSHNIIEAMSVGTIPVLQREYAEQFYPSLQHGKEVFIFNDEESLSALVEEIFETSDEKRKEMREHIANYYRNHLTPNVIIKGILARKEHQKIFLNAEHRSVQLI